MPRVKRGVTSRQRHKKVLKITKGQFGSKSRTIRRSREAMLKSLSYAYRDRRDRKADFRRLWITRINAAARQGGITYGRLIEGLKRAGVEIDRKMLAEMAVSDTAAFNRVVEVARGALQSS